MPDQDDDARGADGRRLASAAYVPTTTRSKDGRAFELRLVRRLRVDGRDERTLAVWSRSFDDADAARLLEAWLTSEAPRLTEFGRIASILGAATLDRLIDGRRDAEAAKAKERRRAAREAEKRAHAIWLLRREVGCDVAVLDLRQGDEPAKPFLRLKFDHAWERDRVWDWASFQKHRWHDWKAHCDEHGAASTERLILAGMLETERAVKKAGLGSGGRRPLRFWRGDPA